MRGGATFQAGKLISALALALAVPAGALAEVTFATEGDYPPWNETQADGELAGFDIDLVNALCKTLDEDCKIVTASFPAMMNTLAEGGFDAIISGIAITEQREEKIAFTRPYMSYSASFATAAGSDVAKDAPASGPGLFLRLAKARIGVQGDTVNAKLMANLLPEATLVTFGDQESLNKAVADGDVDAGFAGTLAWKNPTPAPADSIVVLGPQMTSAQYPLLGRGLGIGIAQGNSALKDTLDKGICELTADGTIESLSEKWFEADLAVPCDEAQR
jgi:octopine/nopaline transport system substrate-binding protein